jgi:hypothetical protein
MKIQALLQGLKRVSAYLMQAFRVGFLQDEGIGTALAKTNFIVGFEHPGISRLCID